MRAKFHRALVVATLFCLPACTTIGSAERQAVRYNWAFNDARNEVLLLNIVRAQYRGPLQFSTISTVSGPMRGNIGVSNAFEWVFHGVDKLTPGGSFTFRDPTVTLTPLDSKEFRQGMMNPLNPKYVSELLQQGWDKDVVRYLVAEDAWIKCVEAPRLVPTVKEVLVTGAEAAKMLKEGAGENTDLEIVSTSKESEDKVRIRMTSKPEDTTLKVDPGLCSSGVLDPKTSRFRSPLAMVNYLGKVASPENEYLTLVRARPGKDTPILVATQLRNISYYIPEGGKSSQTLALLAEIIGFQTSNATLDATKPTVTVSAGGD